jgi:GNAT superfamily N-acetyltransferase
MALDPDALPARILPDEQAYALDVLGAAAELTIRPAAIADLPGTARLAVAERGGEHAEWQARFAADLPDPDACLLLAEAGGHVTAYGRARRFDPPRDAPASIAPAGYYLSGLLVAPAYRRRGIGEQLTRARMAWAATRHGDLVFRQRVRSPATSPTQASRSPAAWASSAGPSLTADPLTR